MTTRTFRTANSDARRGVRVFTLVALVGCLAGQATGAARAEDVPIDGIAAVVNESVVLNSDVRAETAFVKTQAASNRQDLPSDDVLRTRVLERLVDQEIRRQRAASLGVSVDATAVNRAVESVARGNNMDALQFRQTLLQQGFDFEQFRRGIEQELLLQRLVERDVEPRVRVSAREIDDYVSALRDDANEQRRYRLRHILLAVAASASAEEVAATRARADGIVARLEAGDDFASVAAAESDDARALEGGDLGFRTLQEVPAFLREAIVKLEPGDISDVLRSSDGLHIIRIDERQDANGGQRAETRARHIFIASDAEDTADRLAKVRRRILSGESFASVAETTSEDPNSAPEGGELPWFSAGELPSEMERVAASLEPGQLSEPFRTQFGWHLLEVLERRVRDIDDEALRRQATNVLSRQRIEEETERWVRRLRDESFIEERS